MVVESVARAIKIVETLAETPAGLSETARRVDLPKSTVARLLATLEELGVVERDPAGSRYQIGPMVQRLATFAGGAPRLTAIARPFLEGLSTKTGEAAGLAVPHGYRMHHVDQTEASQPVQVRDWTGEMAPMHVGPSGFCMMAYWPADQLERYLTEDLARLTPNTVTDTAGIRKRLAEVKEKGYIWAFEEYVEGINSVAAPVLAPGEVIVASLYVYGPAYRFPKPDDEEPIGEMVAEAGLRLSATLAR